MAKLVSRTYGDALFAASEDEGLTGEFREAAEAIREILSRNEDFGRILCHPGISPEEKKGLIEEAFGQDMPPEFIRFMELMTEKGRAESIIASLDYFMALVKEKNRIGQAYVTTALELTGLQKDKIEKKLLLTTGYQDLEMHYKVDESLIGGMIIRIDDRMVDGSIRTKLRDLTRELRR